MDARCEYPRANSAKLPSVTAARSGSANARNG
ncbi:MAG: hypothetical protein EZS28_046640, partial [Streblomastix strix]